jgi:hypothetical protein
MRHSFTADALQSFQTPHSYRSGAEDIQEPLLSEPATPEVADVRLVVNGKAKPQRDPDEDLPHSPFTPKTLGRDNLVHTNHITLTPDDNTAFHCSSYPLTRSASPPAENKATESATDGRLVRAALVAMVVTFAAATRKSLESVESVVGAVCLCFSSLLLPTIFYIAIRYKAGRVGVAMWAAGGFIGVFGGCLMVQIIWQTIQKLRGV